MDLQAAGRAAASGSAGRGWCSSTPSGSRRSRRDPARPLRGEDRRLPRARAAQSEIVVTFRHLEEGWVDTPEPRRESRGAARRPRQGRAAAAGRPTRGGPARRRRRAVPERRPGRRPAGPALPSAVPGRRRPAGRPESGRAAAGGRPRRRPRGRRRAGGGAGAPARAAASGAAGSAGGGAGAAARGRPGAPAARRAGAPTP